MIEMLLSYTSYCTDQKSDAICEKKVAVCLRRNNVRRFRDSSWQYITTTIMSFASLIFTILFSQGDNSLHLVGAVVVIILIFGIVLINVLPTSKAASQPPNVNAVPAPTKNQPQYQYPAYPQTPIYAPPSPGTPIPARRQSRITPTRLWLLTFALIGFIIVLMGGVGPSHIPISSDVLLDVFYLDGMLILGCWLFALVNTARLGYWGWFVLELFLPFGGLGTFIYIFFVPTVPRKASSQHYNQLYNQQDERR